MAEKKLIDHAGSLPACVEAVVVEQRRGHYARGDLPRSVKNILEFWLSNAVSLFFLL